MPNIPDDQPTQGLSPQPSAALPADVSPQELGAGIGSSLATGAEVAQKVYHDAKTVADQAAVMDGYNQLAQWESSTLHDPKQGVLYSGAGLNAPAAVDKTMADYEKNISRIAGGLTNDEQRQAFARTAQNHQASVTDQLNKWEHGQVTEAHNAIGEQAVQSAQTLAVQKADDPDAVTQHIAEQKAAIADLGKWNNLPPEAVQTQTERAVSATHMGVLKQLSVEGQDQKASAWFEAHKGELVGPDLTAATAMVDKGSLDGKAQRLADGFTLNLDGTYITEEDRNRILMTNPALQADPKLRAAVDERLSHNLAQHDAAVQQSKRATFEDLAKKVDASPQGVTDPAVQAQIDTLDAGQRDLLYARARKDVREPDPVALYHWMREASSPETKNARAQEDLTSRGWDPNSKGFQEAARMQDEILRSGSAADAPQIMARDEQITDSLQRAGISTQKDVNGKYTEDYLQATRAIQNAEAGFATDNKRKMTTDERQKMIDQLLIKRVDPSTRTLNPLTWWGGGEKTSYAFQDPMVSSQVHSALQMPQSDLERITKDFTDVGKQPTSGQIADVYNAEKAGISRAPMTPEELNGWVSTLKAGRTSPNYEKTLQKLKRWSTGWAEEGYLEPRLISQAKQIQQAMGVQAQGK